MLEIVDCPLIIDEVGPYQYSLLVKSGNRTLVEPQELSEDMGAGSQTGHIPACQVEMTMVGRLTLKGPVHEL